MLDYWIFDCDRLVGRELDRQRDGNTESVRKMGQVNTRRHTHMQTHTYSYTKYTQKTTDRQAHTDRRTHRQTDTYRQTDTQTDGHGPS